MNTRISKNLSYLRESRGKSKIWVSERISKSDSNIANYESGKTNPPLPILEKYAEIFGVYIGDLVGRDLWLGEGSGDGGGEDDPGRSMIAREKKALHLMLDAKEVTDELVEKEIAKLVREMEGLPPDHPAFGRIEKILEVLKR